jgi:DNA-directed RNA polymerase subunit E"
MPELVCRTCHKIIETRVCPSCSSDNVSTDWAGYVVIIDAEKSKIAKKMNVTSPGRYALKVR